MLKCLDSDAGDPPDGWMACLLEALKGLDERPVLILDDFMCNGMTEHEKTFLLSLKSLLCSSMVSDIVLTSNEDATGMMLTWNGSEGIIPMVDHDVVAECECALHAGSFAMDWLEQAPEHGTEECEGTSNGCCCGPTPQAFENW